MSSDIFFVWFYGAAMLFLGGYLGYLIGRMNGFRICLNILDDAKKKIDE